MANDYTNAALIKGIMELLGGAMGGAGAEKRSKEEMAWQSGESQKTRDWTSGENVLNREQQALDRRLTGQTSASDIIGKQAAPDYLQKMALRNALLTGRSSAVPAYLQSYNGFPRLSAADASWTSPEALKAWDADVRKRASEMVNPPESKTTEMADVSGLAAAEPRSGGSLGAGGATGAVIPGSEWGTGGTSPVDNGVGTGDWLGAVWSTLKNVAPAVALAAIGGPTGLLTAAGIALVKKYLGNQEAAKLQQAGATGAAVAPSAPTGGGGGAAGMPAAAGSSGGMLWGMGGSNVASPSFGGGTTGGGKGPFSGIFGTGMNGAPTTSASGNPFANVVFGNQDLKKKM